jgi:hypothetical protein
MKKLVTITALALHVATMTFASNPVNSNGFSIVAMEKYDIKIKNDSGDEVTVYNAGSGGSYRLTKNATTTIKMEEGDKLYIYEGGKKGRLLLTASAEMNGKVQLFSKL